MNEKNFVGLSVTPAGYIATGSEDNCVVAYHASMPVPVARHCFSHPSIGGSGNVQNGGPFSATGAGAAASSPANGGGGGEATQQFVSSVTWTRAGGAAVASNSQGHLRVLELV